MKKTVFLIFALCLVLGLSLSASATAKDGLCDCGREYAVTDGDGYLAFDCLGCGRNYTSCVCTECWCGDKLERIYDESGALASTRCTGCGLPCEECICRDRSYYNALRNVKNGVSGIDAPNPAGPVPVLLGLILPFAGFCGLYFTVLRRRNSSADNGGRARRTDRMLEKIEKEPDGKRRYALAKARAEAVEDGDERRTRRDVKAVCRKKNEFLADALEEDWVRDAAEENIRVNRVMNDYGFCGSVERIDRLWDGGKKGFVVDRDALSGETAGESTVKWDTRSGQIALFEAVTPLNGQENNLLPGGSNVTPLTASLSEAYLPELPVDPDNADACRETIARLIPAGNIDYLSSLAAQPGEKRRFSMPPQISPRATGNRSRFPGGFKG